ncbi:MAG: HAMP domain-containing sensor histidine kinase [Clostridia bacterium]|nr:HAMP domain-containing sensor histidine kinase [Clostridia bacterium]
MEKMIAGVTMKSIKIRLVTNFMLVILISILILEVLLINFVKHYYYTNTEEILTNQIRISSEFYSRYFANTPLKYNVLDNIDIFWKQTPAQVQIIDERGKVLMDSIGVPAEQPIETIDFKKAIKGEKGSWVGRVDYDDSDVMAVAYPLKSEDRVVGAIRFITSLKEVNNGIKAISTVFVVIGVIVVIISGIVSIFLATSITVPINSVTAVAEKMASGNFKIRSEKKNNDEIGKLSDTLNYMAEEILKKEQLKNEFISSVSHELRTPLTAIKGWAVTLESSDMDDKQIIKDGLRIIDKECDRLTVMVEQLLDFSRLVSSKTTLNKEETQIEDLIFYIEKYLNPRAEREKKFLSVRCQENLPVLTLDGDRIKQVLINVLDNAFKFTEENGQILIEVKEVDHGVEVCIKDNGCGISPQDLPRVKEKFYKGKGSKSQNGIGLSICDEIVNMHGGILEIESELGKGTSVCIRLGQTI